MKKTIAISTLMAFATLMITQPALAGRISKRHDKQEKRIAQGIKSGELTRGEARQLVKQQHRIQHHTKKAWSDGKLSRRERVRLEMHRDKASANIYRLKHNGWNCIQVMNSK